MNLVGALELQFLTNLARLRDDMKKVSDIVENAAKGMENAWAKVKSQIMSLAGAYLGLQGVMKLYGAIKESAMLGAQYETLGVSMAIVGKNAGYFASEMEKSAVGMQKMGISMIESRQQAMRLVQSKIDLTNADKLARIAQDAAVIGNINSSEAFARMIHGIQTGQTEILRNIGLQVNMQQAYQKYADTLNKSVEDLNQAEKSQAILNEVMKRGADIAGTYEAAMGTAGKQLKSMERYVEDVKVRLGEAFNDTLTAIVMSLTEKFKDVNGELDEMSKNHALKEWGEEVTNTLVGIVNAFNNVRIWFAITNSWLGEVQDNIVKTRNAVTSMRVPIQNLGPVGGATFGVGDLAVKGGEAIGGKIVEWMKGLGQVESKLKSVKSDFVGPPVDPRSPGQVYRDEKSAELDSINRYYDTYRTKKKEETKKREDDQKADEDWAKKEKANMKKVYDDMLAAGKIRVEVYDQWIAQLNTREVREEEDPAIKRDKLRLQKTKEFGTQMQKYLQERKELDKKFAEIGGVTPEMDKQLREKYFSKGADRGIKESIETLKQSSREEVRVQENKLSEIDHLRKMEQIGEQEYIDQKAAADIKILQSKEKLLKAEIAEATKRKDNTQQVIGLETQLADTQNAINQRKVKQEEDTAYRMEQIRKKARDNLEAQRKEYQSDWDAENKRIALVNLALEQSLSARDLELKNSGKEAELQVSLVGRSNKEKSIALGFLHEEIKLEAEKKRIFDTGDQTTSQRNERMERAEAQSEEAKRLIVLNAQLAEQEEIWNTIEKTAHDVWTNIFEGGDNVIKKLGQTLKAFLLDMLYQMTIKKWLLNIQTNIMGVIGGITGLGGGSGSGTGGVGGIGGIANLAQMPSGIKTAYGYGQKAWNFLTGGGSSSAAGASSIYNLGYGAVGGGSAIGTGGISYALGGTGTAVGGGGLGMTAGGGLGMTAGGGLGMSTVGAGGETLVAGGGAGAAGLGATGWGLVALAAVAIFSSLFSSKGGPKQGGYWGAPTVNPTGEQVGGMDNPNAEIAKAGQTLVENMNASYENYAKLLGGTAGVKFGVGVSTDPEGKSPTFAEVTARNAAGQGIFSKVDLNVGRSNEEMTTALATMTSEALIEAVRKSGIKQEYLDYFDQISKDLNVEGKIKALDIVAGIAQLTNSFNEMGPSLDHLAASSVEAKGKLVEASGGLDALNANLTTYYENFFTEDEKRTRKIKEITKVLSPFGYTEAQITEAAGADNGKDIFRQWMEAWGSEGWGEGGAGVEASAALLKVSGTFAELVPAAEEAKDALQGLKDEAKNLDVEFARASGDMAEVRRLEIKGYSDAEIAIYDHNKAMQATIALTTDGKSLELDLARAQGDTARVRGIEIAGYNDAQVAIYDHNEALRDEIDAANETNSLKDQTKSLDLDLARAQGDTVRARQLEIVGYDAAQVAIYDHNAALRDEIDAANETNNLRDQTKSLDLDLARAQGDTVRVRQLEIVGYDEAQVAIYDHNAALRDEIDAANTIKNLKDQSKSLDLEFARAQGNTVRVRQLEIAGYNAAEIAIYDHNAALRDEIDAISGAKNALKAAYDNEVNALTTTKTKMEDFTKRFRTFRDALVLSDLSPMTPGQKYTEAKAQFDKIVADMGSSDPKIAAAAFEKFEGASKTLLTLSNDVNASSGQKYAEARQQLDKVVEAMGSSDPKIAAAAADQFESVSQAYLQVSRDYNASSDAYSRDFQMVLDATQDGITWAELQYQNAVDSLEQLKSMVSGLIKLDEDVLSVREAIAALGNLAPDQVGTDASINAIYEMLLGRPADDAGRDWWKAQITLGVSYEDIIAAIMDSPEYKGLVAGVGGTTEAITSLYQDLLARAPDVEGLKYFVQQMDNGASIGDITTQMRNSPEYEVTSLYQELLNRIPDIEGLKYWIEQLAQGVDVRAGLMASPEYVGSHALGLDRVPYNNYPAMLHFDEAVLNRDAANQWRYNTEGGSGSNVVQMSEVVAEIRALREEIRRVAEMQIEANFQANDRAADKVVDGTNNAKSRENFNRKQAQQARTSA